MKIINTASSSGFVSMETRRFCVIAYEVLKDLNERNPNFMEVRIYCSPNLTHMKKNLYVHYRNTKKFWKLEFKRCDVPCDVM